MENEKIKISEIEATEAEDTAEETVTHEQTLKLMSPMQMVIRRFFRSKLSIIGLIMVVSLFLFCWVGPLFYTVSPTEIDKSGKIEYTEKWLPTPTKTVLLTPIYRLLKPSLPTICSLLPVPSILSARTRQVRTFLQDL